MGKYDPGENSVKKYHLCKQHLRKKVALNDCNCRFIRRKVPQNIRGVTAGLGKDGKMTSDYKLVGCLFSEYRKIRIKKNSVFRHFSRSVELNFCWLALSGCNCCFIRPKLHFGIRGVTTLLGNYRKMTLEHKLVGCLIRSPWHEVNDSSIQFFVNFFWVAVVVLLDKNRLMKLGESRLYQGMMWKWRQSMYYLDAWLKFLNM